MDDAMVERLDGVGCVGSVLLGLNGGMNRAATENPAMPVWALAKGQTETMAHYVPYLDKVQTREVDTRG